MEEQEKKVEQANKQERPKDSFQGVSGRMITGIVQVVKKGARKVVKDEVEKPETEQPVAAEATVKALETQPGTAVQREKAETERPVKPVEKPQPSAKTEMEVASKAVQEEKKPLQVEKAEGQKTESKPEVKAEVKVAAPDKTAPTGVSEVKHQEPAVTAEIKAEAPKKEAPLTPVSAQAGEHPAPAPAAREPRIIRDQPLSSTRPPLTDQGVTESTRPTTVYRPQKGNYVGANSQAPSYQRPEGKPRGPQSGSYRSGTPSQSRGSYGGSYNAGYGNRPQGQGSYGNRPQGQGSYGNRAQGQGGFGGRPQGGGYAPRPQGQGGFGARRSNDAFGGDKDRDEAPRQTRSPRQKPKTGMRFDAATQAPELNNKKTDSRKTFAQRNNAKDRNRRDESFEAKQRRPGNDLFFDDEETGRGAKRSRGSKQQAQQVVSGALTQVKLPSTMTVKELAEFLKKTTAEVIMKLMSYGIMATVNNDIDYDTAEVVANEFGIKVEQLIEVSAEDILFDDSEDEADKLVPRPPVVVVMGHVDHGKTSILDYIRNAHVAKGEAGGITQHIGAYTVSLDGRPITFLDTPGHEAFTAMRARGASVTDIAILVVAADDGVMPQTEEAIHHAKAAGTEIIVAINKVDKPGVNLDRVKQELAKHELMSAEWGGSTTIVPVSAKTGQNMDELLEMVLLTADLLELKADPERQAKGTVIEARLDKARGPIATILVQRGTLRLGDTVVVGSIVGKIRAMTSDRGKSLKEAGPSIPVEILGLPSVPEGGDVLYQVENEKLAHSFAERKAKEDHERQLKKGAGSLSLENLFEKMKEGETKELNLIVKADVQGSVEAVTQSMEKLSNDEVRVKVVHGAVGAVTGSDIRLAEVSNAIIIGFNVRPAANVSSMAEEAKVDLRLYRVIYDAIEDVEKAMKGMLAPTMKEFVLGHAEIRETYKVSGVGTIAGCYVTDGKINRNNAVRIVRDGIVIHEGKLASLKRFKDDAREVNSGYECGMSVERFNDLKVGDQFEAFENREVERE